MESIIEGLMYTSNQAVKCEPLYIALQICSLTFGVKSDGFNRTA